MAKGLNRCALVTGGAVRVGKALCLQAAKSGYDVGVHYNRSAQPALDLCSQIEALGVKAVALGADLTLNESPGNGGPGNGGPVTGVASLISAYERAFGRRPELLVNNASVFHPQGLAGYGGEEGWRNWQLHVNAPLLLSQWVAEKKPEPPETMTPGTGPQKLIVNMLDQRVLNPSPGFVSYFASKAALAALTKSLAIELSPHVRVNGIAPGPALPPPGLNSGQKQGSKGGGFSDYCATMPLGYGSSPDELAAVLAFLIGAKPVTGQIIASDGGQHLGYLSPQEALRNQRLDLNSGLS